MFTANASLGLAPYTYLWNFGNGDTSTAANPVYTYPARGIYTVTVTVTDSFWCVSPAIGVAGNPVVVYGPTAAPVVDANPVCQGTPQSFAANASLGLAPYTYLWNFGNGDTSTAANPVYTYPADGSYTVTVTVTDSLGCVFGPVALAGNPVVVYPLPFSDIQPDNPTICYLFKTTLYVNPSGGVLIDISPSVTTVYTVTVTDSSVLACSMVSSETVTVENCWLRSYDHDPGSTSGEEYLFGISETATGGVPDGGFIAAGRSTGSPGGDLDAWVVKVDDDGAIVWQNTYDADGSATYDDYAFSVCQTSPDDGFVVAGGTYSRGSGYEDVWIFKLDSTGTTVEWEKRFGGALYDDWARSIQQTSDGGYIVAGTTQSFPSGRRDYWLLKLDNLGGVTWQKTYGGTEDARAESVQETFSGGVPDGFVVAGWTDNFKPIAECSPICPYEAWILKLDASGTVVWETTHGNTDDSLALSIHQTSDDGYVVGGYTGMDPMGAGDWDAWAFKLNSAGDDVEWERTYDSGDSDIGYSVRQNADGSYVLGGLTKGYDLFGDSTDDWDGWLVKVDANGDVGPAFPGTWEKVYGDGGCAEIDCTDNTDNDGDGFIDELKDDVVYSAREVSDGTFAAVGYTYSFDAGGDSDGMILKVGSSGGIPGDPNCMFVEDASAATGDPPSVLRSNTEVVGDSTAIPADTAAAAASTLVTIGTRCFTFPGEVSPPMSLEPFLFLSTDDMSWEEGSLSDSDMFNLYRGDVTGLPTGDYGTCLQSDLLLNETTDVSVPPSGETWFYLVAGENIEGEGPLGTDSSGVPRESETECP
jgi:PKD repeat protein